MTFLYVLFVVLNILDLILTLLLINSFGNIEGNPMASWCYSQWGIIGMVIWKLFTTSVALSVVNYLAYARKSVYALLVLIFGCVVLIATVLYSVCLFYGVM